MAYEVTCSHCSARFSLTADLYARRIKGRISTIRCPRCSKDTTIDDSAGEGRSPQLKPLTEPDSSRRPEPISERRISHSDASPQQLMPVSTPSAPAAKRLQPPPVPRKTPEVSKKALWIVSYAEDDDRELTVLQIRSALVRGEVTRDTLVWQEGMPSWVPMAQVPELAAILPRAGEVLKHRMPSDKTPRRPSSRPPPKPDAPYRMPPIPGSRAAKPPLPPNKPNASELVAPELDDKPRTRPDLPKPRWANKPVEPVPGARASREDVDAEPPSSGSPALRSLTQQASRAGAPEQGPDDFLLGMQSADPGLLSLSQMDASRLTAPVSDDVAPFEAPAPAPRGERHRVSSASDASSTGENAHEERAPASPRTSAPPMIEEGDPSARPPRSRSALPWVLVLGVVMLGAAWLLLRSPWAARARGGEPETPAAVVAAKPAGEAAPEEPSAPTQPSLAAPETADAAAAGTESPPVPEAAELEKPGRVRAAAPERPKEEPPTSRPSNPAEPASESPAAASAEPAAEPARPAVTSPFDKVAAVSALNNLAAQASACRQAGDPSGIASVVLTFAPSGRVTSATVNGPPFAGTPTGGCVARTLRRAQVPPFAGDHVTVSKTVLVQ